MECDVVQRKIQRDTTPCFGLSVYIVQLLNSYMNNFTSSETTIQILSPESNVEFKFYGR